MVRVMLALAVLLAVGVSGCGSAPPESPPAGVDLLEIPTASPDPADFVDRIDNPWLPLAPGSTWTYERAALDGRTRVETVAVEVAQETREVQGVETTVVEVDDEGRGTTERFYAQDDAGNVWLFGETGGDASWEAGVDGAQAGLAMAATPRLGDGYRLGLAEGVFEGIASVASLEATVDVAAGSYAGVLVVEEGVAGQGGPVTEALYARGVGLVLLEEAGSGETLALLVHSEG